jgi:hypothetical protein
VTGGLGRHALGEEPVGAAIYRDAPFPWTKRDATAVTAYGCTWMWQMKEAGLWIEAAVFKGMWAGGTWWSGPGRGSSGRSVDGTERWFMRHEQGLASRRGVHCKLGKTITEADGWG